MNLQPDCNNEKSNKRLHKNKNSRNGKELKKSQSNQGNEGNGSSCINLIPSELLVIAGIVCKVLQVESVLVSRNQTVEIVLTGSLKRRTQLDKVMEQIGKMPFDQVVKSIMDCSSDE